MKFKARLKAVFCDGTEYTRRGPKLSAKENDEAPDNLALDWQMDQIEHPALTAATMWDRDPEPLPDYISPEVHLVSMTLETKPKDGHWTEVWSGTRKCPCVKLPKIVTEIHRYSKPADAWGFHAIEPDEEKMWAVFPFSAPHAYDLDENFDPDSEPCYKETGRELLGEPDAETHRGVLWDTGYRRQEFTEDLPANFRNFVIHSQCPLEWQVRMETGDQELFDRVVIWVQGELPVVS